MGRLGFCSCPGMGAQLWGGYLGEKEGALLGEIWRQAGEAGHCHFPWGKVMARVGVERNSHLRANKARPLVTDMLQGGSNVDLLHSWWEGCGDTQMLRGCPEEGGPRKPMASWDGRLRGLPGGVATCPPRTPVTPGVGETLIWGWAGDVVGRGLTFRHAVQYHVDEDVGACPPCTITAGGDGDRLSWGPSGKGEGRGHGGLGWRRWWSR